MKSWQNRKRERKMSTTRNSRASREIILTQTKNITTQLSNTKAISLQVKGLFYNWQDISNHIKMFTTIRSCKDLWCNAAELIDHLEGQNFLLLTVVCNKFTVKNKWSYRWPFQSTKEKSERISFQGHKSSINNLSILRM